jgi:ATP-dependent Lon protease
MVAPFFVGRKRSIRAVEAAMSRGKKAFLVTQKSTDNDSPAAADLYPVGTVARVLQTLKLPDGTIRLLVEGLERAHILRFVDKGDYSCAQVKPIREGAALDAQVQALVRVVMAEFRRYAGLYQKLSPEVIQSIDRAAGRGGTREEPNARPDERSNGDTASRAPAAGAGTNGGRPPSGDHHAPGGHPSGGEEAEDRTAEPEGGALRGAGPDRLVNLIGANLPLKTEKKIQLLSIIRLPERLEHLAALLAAESEILELEQKINSKVRKKLEKTQKEYYLHEQLKEIQRELGADQEDPTGARELEIRLQAKGLPEEVLSKCQKELKRLARMQPISPESAVLRTYLEWIADLPWTERAQEKKDIEEAGRILDADHYDLKKVKERVLDFIAVRLLKGSRLRGPILCFAGPPGTGKTSLGRSVARALGREFIRISLGGVRDEAEIRGHRKTYVGALPGKILQAMRKVGTVNPVFLLDEIDKLGSDFRGDPASALLEVLDPEQNFTFVDHYLEVPYDLSNILFITTANSVHTIPHPLRDRMEIIQIPGYTEFEKLKIAEQFLIPKQLKENGLEWADIRFQRPAILKIARNYTMESGVRSLEREIANILRKIARQAVREGRPGSPPVAQPVPQAAAPLGIPLAGIQTSPGCAPAEIPGPDRGEDAHGCAAAPADAPAADRRAEAAAAPSGAPASDFPAQSEGAPFRVLVSERSVRRYLGGEPFPDKMFVRETQPGLAYGLAWTEMGGVLLPVEVALLQGEGKLILTGSLGEVMKESARTALSFLKASAERLAIPADFNCNRDIHIHVPEGAIPKDGPSAGITITAALLSAAAGLPLPRGFAMTGEITLTGRLLSVGGIKEKILAAHRNQMTDVLLPEANRKDMEELPREVLSSLKLLFADSILSALLVLFPGKIGPHQAKTA